MMDVGAVEHEAGMTILPPAPRDVVWIVAAVAAIAQVNAVAIAAKATQEMVDQDLKKIEDFDAAATRANFVFLQTVEPRDVME